MNSAEKAILIQALKILTDKMTDEGTVEGTFTVHGKNYSLILKEIHE